MILEESLRNALILMVPAMESIKPRGKDTLSASAFTDHKGRKIPVGYLIILLLVRNPFCAPSNFPEVGDLPYISETDQQSVALGIGEL